MKHTTRAKCELTDDTVIPPQTKWIFAAFLLLCVVIAALYFWNRSEGQSQAAGPKAFVSATEARAASSPAPTLARTPAVFTMP